jgi:FlaA1/EpsC-like NDP-sugar epimerase
MLKRHLARLAPPMLALPRPAKRILVVLLDVSLCILTVWLAYYLRLGEFINFTEQSQWAAGATWATAASIAFAIPIFIVSGLYRAIFRYSGWPALLAVGHAISVYGLLYASAFAVFGLDGVPRTIGIIQPILLLLFVGAARALARVWLGGMYQSQLKLSGLPKVLIYGAGNTGRQLAAAMRNSHEMRVVGFLDDDDRLHGHVLNGLPIYNPADLAQLADTICISDVLLALPSISRKRRNEILNQMLHVKVAVRTLPSFTHLAQGKISISDVHELDIDDLLGREPVTPNHILLGKNIRGKVVLVTGAGGSIGSELCRQALKLNPAKLLLVELSEHALYSIHTELEQLRLTLNVAADGGAESPTCPLVPLLASVRDEERMREIISTWRPDTVYHAAAYKHVPLVEHNPSEGIKNNVFGTLATAKAAAEYGVSDFVLISTDKAVRPTNIMGASKRLAEMTLQALAAMSYDTRFSMVRFGNVLGSSGSVVPRFRQQIRDGGPITLTHPEITRYFMTIPEASQLVIQAGAMAKGGDVFVLDMGQPVRIIDLASRMVELSGLTVQDESNPDGDIGIEISGLRPGEKLYEELLIGENPQGTSHSRIMKAHEDFLAWNALEAKLNSLELALSVNDVGVVKVMLEELVSGYTPNEDIVDWIYLEQEAENSALEGTG